MMKNKNTIKISAENMSVIKKLLIVLAVVILIGGAAYYSKASASSDATQLYAEAQKEIFPADGFQTKIVLGDLGPKLGSSGTMDVERMKALYLERGVAEEKLKFLTEASNEPLVLNYENANIMLNLFWAAGIANKNPILDEMAKYEKVANLASTGGWSLAKGDPMNYFNKVELIDLTSEQQALVEEVAKNMYRPCCDNPTWFPDCNHGAALLALLELGASQGLTKEELYTLALQVNTLWFPQQYLETAVYFKSQGKGYWENAQEIVGPQYSSYSGWAKNVHKPLSEMGLIPEVSGGGSCGV